MGENNLFFHSVVTNSRHTLKIRRAFLDFFVIQIMKVY